jgi:hypothetical protein
MTLAESALWNGNPARLAEGLTSAAGFSPGKGAEWLEGRLPRPVDDASV